jgi:signal transduction histidine kinase
MGDRSAILRFLAGSVLAIAVVLVAGYFVLRSVTISEAERQTRGEVRLQARLVQAAGLTDGVLTGDRRALRKLDDVVVGQLASPSLVRVKVWTRSGRILYSDEPRLIGQRFALGEEEQDLFTEGGADAELSDLSDPENRYERQEGKLLEAHTVVRTPGGTPVLFETYQRFSSISSNGARLLKAIAPPVIGALAVLLLIQVPLALSLARRLSRGHAEREELLRAAVDASDTERRRIAADLHDGAVQDLAGVAFGLAPLADAASEPEKGQLEDAIGRLRQGVRDLRTLLVEIHPPALSSTGLEAALSDLLSPLAAAGLETSLDVDPDVPPDPLMYRVAREAVRNVAAHAEASRVSVRVTPGRLVVADDGRGFAPGDRERRRAEGHLGLSLLEGIVRQAGGTLSVTSTPGAGSTVTLEMGA